MQRRKIIHDDMKRDVSYWRYKKNVKSYIESNTSSVDLNNDLNSLKDIMEKVDSHSFFKKIVHQYFFSHKADHGIENGFIEVEIEAVIDAREKWEASLCEELIAVALERKESIIFKRKGSEGIINSDTSKVRFLYDSEDLLEVITGIRSNNLVIQPGRVCGSCWGLINLQLTTPTASALASLFSDLHPQHKQTGIDDTFEDDSKFLNERIKLANKALKSGFIPALRQYSKRGIIHAFRPKIWRLLAGLPLEVSNEENIQYQSLKQHYKDFSYITDDLFCLDVSQICLDDNYFPFEDVITDTVITWSRDPWLLYNCKVQVNSIFNGTDEEDKTYGAVPPCGVQPFRGLAYMVAPLAYIYPDSISTLFVFRHIFAKLWCRLNVLSSKDDTLIFLCKMFEDLLASHRPQLILHCKSLGIMPLNIAFPWIHKAFAGYLPVDQVLLLWDRLLAYDNLYLLPILSCAIFMFRSNDIMESTDSSEVLDSFQDTARLKVIPLIQQFLYNSSLLIEK